MAPSTKRTPKHPSTLAAYLPLDRRQALAAGGDLPERGEGSVLFADVSGFTPLMEHLANTLGPQQGAEELTHLLNALFTPMIDQVHGYGGSIIAFGGDALTCWFPGAMPKTAPAATACALAMQRQVAAFRPAALVSGATALSMHVGIATGPVRRFCVGQAPHGLRDVLAGTTVDRMVEAEGHAGAGGIAVDEATAAYLPPEALRPRRGPFSLLQPGWVQAPPPAIDTTLPSLPSRRVRPWLAEPLYRRLQAGRGEFAAELRLVTSLFVQFGGLDYDEDPAAGRKLHEYVGLAQDHLGRYDGYLALVACGDKGSLLHALFGAPVAHEDDSERAVGFALGFQEAVAGLPFITSQRIGISRGRVYAGILGSLERCTYTVLGDEVNVSARLMQAARPGQVLTSGRLEHVLASPYALRPLGAVPVKGKEEPVPIFEPVLAQEQPAVQEDEQLVGRAREEALLGELMAAVESGRGQALTIIGEAGVGKSALTRFLLRQAGRHGWRLQVGACLSYGRDTPYLPWRAVLEQIAGITPEMSAAERTACLERAVAALPERAERPGYWRARFPLLAEAMGMAVEETPLTRSLEGELRRDNTFQLLEELIRGLARERPAVVVLEDAYWGDELSLGLAAHISRGLEGLPFLLALVLRPSSSPLAAALQAIRSLPWQTTLNLSALAQTSALELAQQRLRADRLAPGLEALLQQRAQGNPFFIEELLRALQEGGHLRRVEGAPPGPDRWAADGRAPVSAESTAAVVELAGAWETLELPETIEEIVRARMDRLPEGERLTLKVASVIGRTFERPLLREVHPAQPAEPALVRQLDHLGTAAFVALEEPAPEWRFAFRHPILHEVTYGTLLFAQRRQLHGGIGQVLERWYGGELPGTLDLLAYHYARSEEREKAVYYLQRAAEKARREYANEVALGYYSQALERLLAEEQELRYDLLAGRERIYDLLGEREAQERDLDEMAALAKELGEPRRQVLVLNRRARRAVDMGEFPEADAVARQARELAEASAEYAGAAEALKILGIIQASQGQYGEAQGFLTRAGETYRRLGDHAGETSCLGNLGLVYLYQGNAEQARAVIAQTLELIRTYENRLLEARTLINLGLAESTLGAVEDSLSHYRQALAICREIGNTANEEIVLINSGAVATALGDLTAAAADYEQALQLARMLQDQEGEATALQNIGVVALYQGELDRGRQLLEKALAQYQALGSPRWEANAWHSLGLARLWSGDPAAARDSFSRAFAILEEIGESGNALIAQAWLGLACLATGETDLARECVERTWKQLQAKGYSGSEPEQEVWWVLSQLWRAAGEVELADQALQRARQILELQSSRIHDPALRQAFWNRYREIPRG